jgi:protein-tyrosine sulfotransferase
MNMASTSRVLISRLDPLAFRMAGILPRYRGDYVSDSAPIIIGGCGRSGTTLLRVILDTHSEICCGPESNLLCCWRPRGYVISSLARRFEMDSEEIRALFNDSRTHAEFIDHFFARVCENENAKFWSEKSPRNVHAIDYIFRHFPKARFIHMIRDGRDTVCSLRNHPRHRVVNGELIPTNIDNPISYCVNRWVTDVEAGLKYRNDPRYIEVRYEDLVLRSRESVEKLFEFLQMPMEEDVLAYHQVKSESRDVTKFPQNPEAVKPMYSSAIGRWQDSFSDADREYFKRHAGETLRQLGYAESDKW